MDHMRYLPIILLLLGHTLHAQQAPDCGNCQCALPSMPGITLTTSVTHGPCDTTVPHTLIVSNFGRFYAIQGNAYTISLCGSQWNTRIYVTTNTTVPGVIQCDDDGCGVVGGPSTLNFLPGQTGIYRLYVFQGACGSFFSPGTEMELSITCTTTPMPPNDEPCAATFLPAASSCSLIASTNMGATNTAVSAPPVCNGAVPLYTGGDVWFEGVVPPSRLVRIETVEDQLCAGMFQVYTSSNGTCSGTLTAVANACAFRGFSGPTSEPALVWDAAASGVPVGSPYWIRYWERNGNENGSFSICAYEVQRPGNDEPCGSIELQLNLACEPETHIFEHASVLTTVVTSPAIPTCGITAFMSDTWFHFTVPNPLPPNWSGITVSTGAGTHNNLAMAWYTLTSGTICGPGTLTQIACNATAQGGGPMPIINSAAAGVALQPGQIVYVRLWSETPDMGSFTICALMNVPPVNDDPCGAIPLSLNYGCLMAPFSNASATTTGTTPPGVANAPNPTCGLPVYNDLWFTVTVPPNGIVQFDTQAGGLMDGAMAVYRVISGSCGTNDLALQQVACAVAGSQQGVPSNQMPYLNISGQPPGETLYIRIWRQGISNTDGDFLLCARRTDNPPGTCFYTLTMQDSGGDGWGGSYVTLCINGVCTNYTVTGAFASINVGVYAGQFFTVTYTAVGGDQAEHAYVVTQYNQPFYASGTNPAQGLVYSTIVTCTPPPAPPADCNGGVHTCTMAPLNVHFMGDPLVSDLDEGNQGCLEEGENQGIWVLFNTEHIGGSLAFEIMPVDPTNSTNVDFALWGPYVHPLLAVPGDMVWTGLQDCPPEGAPSRCSFAEGEGATGLDFDADLPLSENASGTGHVRHLDAGPYQHYLLYLDRRSGPATHFIITWPTPPPMYQPWAQIGCTIYDIIIVAVEETVTEQVRLHPNPNDGRFTLTSDGKDADVELQLLDLGGRLVHTQRLRLSANGNTPVDLGGSVANGSYLLVIQNAGERQVHRLLVQ
jgi:hypothetical protein